MIYNRFAKRLILLAVFFLSGCATVQDAAYDGRLDQVTESLDGGKATVHERSDDSECTSCTLLHYAAAGGQVEVAKLLIERGANMNAPSGMGDTPLHMASQNLHLEMVRFLLANGADASVNVRDSHGNTPLLLAAAVQTPQKSRVMTDGTGVVWIGTARGQPDEQRAIQVAQVLLAAGADPNITTAQGNSPLHISAYRGYAEIVKFLLRNGADPTRRNKRGQTPEELARQYEKDDIADILRAIATN